VVERRNPTVVGTFHEARKRHRGGDAKDLPHGNWVAPFDSRMAQPILITGDAPLPDAVVDTRNRVLDEVALRAARYEGLDGLIVDVEITAWPTATRPARGRVIEVLGHPEDFGVDVEIMVRKHQLPRIFPEQVLAEARAVAVPNPPTADAEEAARREDFRSLPIVTIDGETARDFDDAVLVRRLTDDAEAAWELQVHIADVSHYVRPGTDLDLEARLRGTSVYFPDRAIPMLPHELSTGICSLRPGEDRFVLSCILRLDEEAHIVSFRMAEGVIRSAARMTYTQVHRILEGDAETRAEFAALVPAFESMRTLAGVMNQRRAERGSIDFDLPEPVIEFDADGQMQGVRRAERTWANRLIEEFMLAANECVATWLEDLGLPSLSRIHEQPDPRRVMDFEEAAAALGHSLGIGALPVRRFQPRGDRREQQRRGHNVRESRVIELPEKIDVTPQMYQRLAARISGHPEERILNHLMLRSLKQARYSEINEGHFALAAPSYTHFTSPIRRYPDLIVHRIAKAALRAGASSTQRLEDARMQSPWKTKTTAEQRVRPHLRATAGAALPVLIPVAELAAIASESSQAERRAAEAERELVEWKKVRFMQDRVGEDFDAIILNPAKFGLFVELNELFVEGLIPIETLPGDRYTYRENTREIVGTHTGRRFRAGDPLRVVLDRVLAFERKLQFAILEDSSQALRPKSAPSKAKKRNSAPTAPKFRPPKAALKKGNRKKKNKGG
jgi:ribonuclease R